MFSVGSQSVMKFLVLSLMFAVASADLFVETGRYSIEKQPFEKF